MRDPLGIRDLARISVAVKFFIIGPRSREHIGIRRIIVAISGNLDTQHTILGSIK